MLARLGLARAFAIEGNTPKARAAYLDFLTTWKDADSDLPILIQRKLSTQSCSESQGLVLMDVSFEFSSRQSSQ
jgi:hypothetical protein